jgi:hypothetical protein
MAEHPNVVRIRDGYAAFAKGDFAALNNLFAEDLLWHDAGRNQTSGEYRGREAVYGFFGKLMEITEGSFRPTFMPSSPMMNKARLVEGAPPRCPRTAVNNQRSPSAATSEPEGRATSDLARNAREYPRNA